MQIFIILFGAIALLVSAWAIWSIVKSPALKKKPLWIIGSLVGFIGFSINWTTPEKLYGFVGVQLPLFRIFSVVGSGEWAVNFGFPIIAVIALVKTYREKSGSAANH